jgi:hypothetical protein
VEPAFRELLLQKLRLSSERYGHGLDVDLRRYDQPLENDWPALKAELAVLFRSRFSATVPDQPREPRMPNEDARTVLAELGIGPDEVRALHDAGAFGDTPLDT